MAAFMALPAQKRLRVLRKTHIPNTALPGLAARAEALGVRVLHYARVQYGTPLWGGVQLQYKTVKGEYAEVFDLLVAATGVSPRLKELPLIADAARAHRAPVVVGGPVRHRPILDDSGRWKNLPPLYPMGAHAVMRAGFGANTLASATVYLPLTLPHILKDAGLKAAGLEDRIHAFYAGQYAAWHDRPAYTEGWLAMLREAGFEGVTAKTFLLEQLPPFNNEQTAYLGGLLASWREDDDLRAALEPEDRAALAALTDPQGATYALTRADLYLLEGATVYLGWA